MSMTVFEQHAVSFPIQNIPQVVNLFRKELAKNEPDLLLLSLVVGVIENTITFNQPKVLPQEEDDDIDVDNMSLGDVELSIVGSLYAKFHSFIKDNVEPLPSADRYANQELIETVSDVICNSLSRSYRTDKAHLQSLYTYLTDSKLDAYGVAFAVVAACQILGYNDVHLALSEAHAWVVFGSNGSENLEVTWLGKGVDDKRGQIVNSQTECGSWIYVNDHPIICNRHMEVCAIVTSINPNVKQSIDSFEVGTLKKTLLWLLYDEGHLSRFPMSLSNLANLEELSITPNRKICAVIYGEAISAAQTFYNDMFVYPYIYQAGYFYRHNMVKETFASWANASRVISKYRFTKDDEELYKEMMDIAYKLIPNFLKKNTCSEMQAVLKSPQCYAYLLLIYDGLCLWVEDGTTLVLHIKWAEHFINSISKFDDIVRTRLNILEPKDLENDCTLNHSTHVRNFNNNRSMSEKLVQSTHCIDNVTACIENKLNQTFMGEGESSAGNLESLIICVPSQAHFAETTLNDNEPGTKIVLKSFKMKCMKDLLIAKKLNLQAISLQLCAQSLDRKRHVSAETAEPISRRNRRKLN